jgi:alcohol dehydrogenase class IV
MVVFDGIEPNPTLANIDTGKTKYLATGCDAVMALGGGSPIDAAKIIAHDCGATALVALPTTAGTGSEVSGWSVISDSATLEKRSVFTRAPDMALLDPVLTVTMPPRLTFFTAVDAFSHALESYLSKSANCFSDSLSSKSIHLTAQNLAVAVTNGNDMAARTGLLEASLLSGIAMMSAGLGAGHAMANTIGGVYHDSVHGWLVAQVLENVWQFNRENRADKIKDIEVPVQNTFARIRELATHLNLTRDTIKKQHLELIVENSLKNINMQTNPRDVKREDIMVIVEACFKCL